MERSVVEAKHYVYRGKVALCDDTPLYIVFVVPT